MEPLTSFFFQNFVSLHSIPIINLIFSLRGKKSGRNSERKHTEVVQFADSTRCRYELYIPHVSLLSLHIRWKHEFGAIPLSFGVWLLFIIVRWRGVFCVCDINWRCFGSFIRSFPLGAFHHAESNRVANTSVFRFPLALILSFPPRLTMILNLNVMVICWMTAITFPAYRNWNFNKWYRHRKSAGHRARTHWICCLSCCHFQITFYIWLAIGCQLAYWIVSLSLCLLSRQSIIGPSFFFRPKWRCHSKHNNYTRLSIITPNEKKVRLTKYFEVKFCRLFPPTKSRYPRQLQMFQRLNICFKSYIVLYRSRNRITFNLLHWVCANETATYTVSTWHVLRVGKPNKHSGIERFELKQNANLLI